MIELVATTGRQMIGNERIVRRDYLKDWWLRRRKSGWSVGDEEKISNRS
jgi:hypothetical protein